MLIFYFLIIIFSFIVCIAFLLFFLFEIVAIFTTDAPFVSVPPNTHDKIVETLMLRPDSILYDLGCGNGRVLINAVQKNPQIKAVGIENSWVPYLIAKFLSRKYKNIEIRKENIFKSDISEATHFFLYLYPKVMENLLPIIEKKCKAGTMIVSCDFQDKNRTPDKTIDLDLKSLRGKHLFVYIIK